MATRKPAEKPKPEVVEESPQSNPVDLPDKAAPLEAAPPVRVPSPLGSTFAERAAANKEFAAKRGERKG